ncbi:MAG: hypothetical protein IPJ32_16625 [Sphingobacteriaceae bacterium]|nr:hypothetical protein [Sphingobacteriaceae bacterium]
MKTRKILLTTISAIVLFTACKKPEKGDVGPTGPIGSTGATGSPNVIYSDWQTSLSASRDTTIDGTCFRLRHLNAPSLTQGILDSGLVITYMRVGSIGPYLLPYTSDAGGATNQLNCVYKTNVIYLTRHTFGSCRFTSASPGTEPVLVNLPSSLEYRYVIIPGAIAGGRYIQSNNTMSIEEIKKLSYEQMLIKFNIPLNGSNE